MAANFNHILAGKSARGAEYGEHDFIHNFAIEQNVAVVDGMRGSSGRLGESFSLRGKNSIANGQCRRARNADHGKPAFAERCGYGCDGIKFVQTYVGGNWVFCQDGLSVTVTVSNLVFAVATLEKKAGFFVTLFMEVMEQAGVGSARQLFG